MNPDDLRAVFARHEHLTPAAEPIAARIEEGYRRRRRHRVVLRSAGLAAATVVAVAAPAVAIHAVGAQQRPAPGASQPTAPAVRTGPLNFLLAGVDSRPGHKPTDLSRADTIVIVHIPATRDRVYLVSIPRDTRVSIQASGRYRGGTDKINAAYAYGGVALLRQTVQADFGIRIDGSMVVDFVGFQTVLNTLGGVDMCIDERTVSMFIGTDAKGRFAAPYTVDANGVPHPVPGVTPTVYETGCRRLAPWEALDYVRQRESLPGGDTDRQRHTRQLLTALVKRVRTSGVLADGTRAAAFLRQVQAAVSVDSGGLSALTLMTALSASVDGTPIGVQLPTRLYVTPESGDAVVVSDEGRDLLTALGHDDLDRWTAAHPDAVSG